MEDRKGTDIGQRLYQKGFEKERLKTENEQMKKLEANYQVTIKKASLTGKIEPSYRGPPTGHALYELSHEQAKKRDERL